MAEDVQLRVQSEQWSSSRVLSELGNPDSDTDIQPTDSGRPVIFVYGLEAPISNRGYYLRIVMPGSGKPVTAGVYPE